MALNSRTGFNRGFNNYQSVFDDTTNSPIPVVNENQDKVIKLVSDTGWSAARTVKFIVTPELSEARNVNYLEIAEMRQAGGLLVYIGTQPRNYTLNARFVSRTQAEADISYQYLHILKSWATPNKAATSGDGAKLGTLNGPQNETRTGGEENAPEVLRLYGYGYNTQLRGVPTVMTSLSIEYPANISYIKATNEAQVPIIQTISIGLKEARNMDELSNFSLGSFKAGILEGW